MSDSAQISSGSLFSTQKDQRKKRRARRTWCEVVVIRSRSMNNHLVIQIVTVTDCCCCCPLHSMPLHTPSLFFYDYSHARLFVNFPVSSRMQVKLASGQHLSVFFQRTFNILCTATYHLSTCLYVSSLVLFSFQLISQSMSLVA